MAFSFFKKSKPEEPVRSTPGYRELVIRQVIRETADSVRVVFEKPDGAFEYQAGQFITLIVTPEGKEERRSYSLCSSPVADEYPAIGIKRVEGGKVSGWCVANLKAGDRIRIMDPMGSFTIAWDTTKARHLCLIAGGSGITPMLALLRTLLRTESESRVTLIYGNRNEESIMFRRLLEDELAAYPDRVKILHVLDQAPAAGSWLAGPVNDVVLKAAEQQWTVAGWEAPASYMICGPAPMMDAVTRLLESRGIATEAIRKEIFTPSASVKPAVVSADLPHEVTVRYDGQEYRFTVQPGRSILETALSEGIDLPYSCQSGMCTACRGKALSGQVRLDEEDGLTKAEREEGYVLTCVGHPLTDDVVIEIG